MEKPVKNFLISPRRQEFNELDGFLFVPDDDLNIPYENTPTKSPCRSPFRNSFVSTLISALITAVSSENVLVTNIAKTMLTGAASTLSSAYIAGVPGMAVGALIAGGIYAYRTLKNKSAIEILKSLSPLQQKELAVRMKNSLRLLGVQNLANEIINRSEVKEIALKVLSEFLQEKYGLRLTRA